MSTRITDSGAAPGYRFCGDEAEQPRECSVFQADGDPWPRPLRQWHQDSTNPITQSDQPLLRALLDHMRCGERLTVAYRGGLEPALMRQITPLFIFSKTNYSALYVLAWCHKREAPRTLRVDLLDLPSLDSPASP